MTMRCDGCGLRVDEISIMTAEGAQCRYCQDCHAVYQEWVQLCLVKESEVNRLLDLFIEESRRHLPLTLVPQDFPQAPALAPNEMARLA